MHGVHFNNCIPSVFALLPGKSKDLYQRFLGALKNLEEGLQPTSVMMDFERGAIDAFETALSGVSIRGCLFHVAQCLWRKVQGKGKDLRYSNDAEFAVQVKMLSTLDFLPIQDVVAGFEDLLESEYYRNEEDIEPISDYFEDVWIARLGRRQRKLPLFTHSLWNYTVSALLPVMTYGTETWQLTRAVVNKMKITQRGIMLGISLRDKQINTWIKQRTGVQDVVIKITKQQ